MNFLYRVLIIFSVSLMFSSLGLAKEETLEDIASEINDIREQISNLETSNVKEAIKIDKALKELDKVNNQEQQSLNNYFQVNFHQQYSDRFVLLLKRSHMLLSIQKNQYFF